MSRQRSHCIIRHKPSILNDDIKENFKDVEEESDADDNKIKIENDKFAKDKRFISRLSLKNNNDILSLNIKTPVFQDLKKEYSSNQSKPLFIHEKAQIIGNFDRSQVGDIEKHSQIIDFEKFLHQFKSEEEVGNLELQDIIDIDYEQLEELKYKATEFIDATSLIMDEKENAKLNTESESNLLLFFSQKLQEMKINEINLQIFVNNLNRVSGILYSNNGVKVFFKQ